MVIMVMFFNVCFFPSFKLLNRGLVHLSSWTIIIPTLTRTGAERTEAVATTTSVVAIDVMSMSALPQHLVKIFLDIMKICPCNILQFFRAVKR